MAVRTFKGSFAFPDSSANLSITGIGFQPDAVIFWTTRQAAAGFADDKALHVGWAVSSSAQGGVAFFADDNVAVGTSNGSDITNLFCVKAVTCAASSVSTTLDASFVSMDPDGFTIDPVNVSVGALFIVHYFCIGGLDNAFAGRFSIPTTAISQAYTGVGFQPDCLLVLSNLFGTGNRSDVGHKLTIGAASSVADQAYLYIGGSNAIPTALASVQSTGAVMRTLNFAGTDNTTGALQSFDPDGFTINYSVVPGTARDFFALALKGANFKVATDTQKTSTGTQAKTGIGFQPKGLLLFGTNRASSASVNSTLASLSIGASDGTHEGTSWVGGAEVNPTEEDTATLTDKVFVHATAPATTDADADLSSFDSDGYTLNWSTADATAREFIGLSIGQGVSTTPPFRPAMTSRGTSW